jgi:hypothetical protein
MMTMNMRKISERNLAALLGMALAIGVGRAGIDVRTGAEGRL